MKPILLVLSLGWLTACSTFSNHPLNNNEAIADTSIPVEPCVGTTELPAFVSESFHAIDDAALLASALGEPSQGKLCQGQVYQSKEDSQVVVYRAWNSTNPNSQFGSWWAFNEPSGKIAQYRSDFEICYQWSPLDKMVRCTLKAGAKVVVGNGQSAQCSQYLTYPVSAAQQVFMEQASEALYNCQQFDGLMSWQAVHSSLGEISHSKEKQ